MEIYKNYERTIQASLEESLSKIINKITDNSVVFDVGCSSGMLGKYLSEKKGCVVDGVDIDKAAIELCRPIYRQVVAKNLEVDSLTDVFKLQEYDFIVVADVIEHIVNPDNLLSELKKLIKPTGTIIFSVPNVTHIASGFELLLGNFKYSPNGLLDNTHLRFYSKQSLLDKLESFGLYAWEIDTVQKEISETEFSEHISKLFPEHWTEELVAYREDALTYQWLVSTRTIPNNSELATKSAQLNERKLPLLFTTTLYWKDNEDVDFTEEKQLLGQLVAKKEGVSLIEFHISESSDINSAIEQIRIDPVSDQKPFLIVNAEILDVAQDVIWAWNPNNSNDEFHGAVLVKYMDSIGSLFQSTNNDPQWHPHIDKEILSKLGVGYTIRVSLIMDDPLIYQYYNELINRDVIERDGQIARLNQAVVEHYGQIASLNQTLNERDGQIASLNQTLNERDGQIAGLNQGAAERDADHQKTLDHICNSRCWRLTWPIRFLGKQWMRLRYIVKLLPSAIKRSNGLKATISKAFRIYRNEGLTGIRRVLLTLPTVSPATAIEVKFYPEIPKINFDQSSNGYGEYKKNPAISSSVKLIAFYLPQFHPFPENDEWWGKGFTEWTNVGKAKPNYKGHYQPHCPIHHGYYDLRIPEVMEEQAKLAKEYGIYGFSYYFYWFGGKILMDTPLELMLANKKVDIPFCFTWANENWSRRWDGQENDILIAQDHSNEDSLSFIQHLVKYFQDERYIKIDGKPVLIIYRADIIPEIAETAKIWRDELLKYDIPGLYLISAQSFGIRSPEPFNFDASVEFPPHTIISSEINNEVELLNKNYSGRIYSYEQVAKNAVLSSEPDYKLFRTAMLSWDNTARKQNNSHIFHGFSLLLYKQWLSSIVNKVYSNPKYNTDEKIVFVNAWNEWAEGTHLEPDQKLGYGYLQTTYDVLENYDFQPKKLTVKPHNIVKKSDYAVIAHVHYEELWPNISKYLLNSFNKNEFDLYVSVTSLAIARKVLEDFPDANIELAENRGRDILPFINMLKAIQGLDYIAVCKIHSKRSIYRNDGDEIRNEIYSALMGSKEQVAAILSKFRNNPKLGMVAAQNYLIKHNDHNMTFDKEVVSKISKLLKVDFKYDVFPAGSMFWFAPNSLAPLLSINDNIFEIESGLADGTYAHAIERIFCVLVKNQNYEIESC